LKPVAGIAGAVAVATSGKHWLVLRSDGTILSWGHNSQGQLGSEAALDRRLGRPMPRPTETPAPVRDITSAVAIAAGEEHSVALLADGTVRTWGIGTHGVPGDGTFETNPVLAVPSLAPTRVTGIDNAVAVAASGFFSFARIADGTIKAWGRNDLMGGTAGALGTGTDESTGVPKPVMGITDAAGVAAGSGGVAAAVLTDGTVRAWGYGHGTHRGTAGPASNTPLPIEGITKAVAISPYMALLRDGRVQEFPTRQARWTSPPFSNVVAIASDHVNRLALLADGRLMAWGHKQFYPDGPIVRAELGVETARQCAAR
jgi:alpha-tubulin suppressor-like RCC1 family protein